jgi:hypothetical protein
MVRAVSPPIRLLRLLLSNVSIRENIWVFFVIYSVMFQSGFMDLGRTLALGPSRFSMAADLSRNFSEFTCVRLM